MFLQENYWNLQPLLDDAYYANNIQRLLSDTNPGNSEAIVFLINN